MMVDSRCGVELPTCMSKSIPVQYVPESSSVMYSIFMTEMYTENLQLTDAAVLSTASCGLNNTCMH